MNAPAASSADTFQTCTPPPENQRFSPSSRLLTMGTLRIGCSSFMGRCSPAKEHGTIHRARQRRPPGQAARSPPLTSSWAARGKSSRTQKRGADRRGTRAHRPTASRPQWRNGAPARPPPRISAFHRLSLFQRARRPLLAAAHPEIEADLAPPRGAPCEPEGTPPKNRDQGADQNTPFTRSRSSAPCCGSRSKGEPGAEGSPRSLRSRAIRWILKKALAPLRSRLAPRKAPAPRARDRSAVGIEPMVWLPGTSRACLAQRSGAPSCAGRQAPCSRLAHRAKAPAWLEAPGDSRRLQLYPEQRRRPSSPARPRLRGDERA